MRQTMQNLEKIQFTMITPREELQAFVKTIWFCDNKENKENLEYKIFNDCGASVVYNFDGNINYRVGDQTLTSAKESVIMGPSKELIRMNFIGPIQNIGIHFFPATGHHFFKCFMDKLSDNFFKTSNDLFFENERLYSKLEECYRRGVEQRIIVEIVENHLLEILRQTKSKSQEKLINILTAIQLDHEVSLSMISDRFDISLRDIQRLFKKYVGVSPKTYISLNKVKNVKDKIANNEFESLTKLSLDSGYFDQAHFIRDFKKFMEDTPRKYHKYKK